jgi:hypothetical protein
MAMLSRYETAIEKGLYKAINELMRLQAARQDATNFTEIGFVSQKTEKMEINQRFPLEKNIEDLQNQNCFKNKRRDEKLTG